MLKFNPVTILIIAAFLFPLLRGFIVEFSSSSLKNDIDQAEGDVAFIISLIAGFFFAKKVFIQHQKGFYNDLYERIPYNFRNVIESKPIILYLIILPVIIFLIYNIIKLVTNIINALILYPVVDVIDRSIRNRSHIFKRFLSSVFELPKAMAYVLILTFILNTLSILNISNGLDGYLLNSKPYNYLCKNIVIPITNSRLAKQLPTILNNSFKVEIVEKTNGSSDKSSNSRTIVYYNGITLEDGIKSRDEIDSFAKELTINEYGDRAKARAIYEWVGSSISYDNEKANSILNNDFSMESGAIATFRDKKGICFDYACLYIAMSRSVGLQVRLVTGEGFNGVSWVSHAWNEVYIEEEERWISVDPTFYKGGDYFDSKRFDLDHKNNKVVAQW